MTPTATDTNGRQAKGGYLQRTFASLAIRNFRLYFFGQGLSLVGTFMQGVAHAWLVLTLTESATAVGIVSALQFGPLLFLGPWGGVIADRFPKRRLLMLTQATAGILALLLWGLVVTHTVQIWMVYAIACVLGLVNVVDNPVRQSFAYEMVGREQVANAVTLNSMALNTSRIVGPALAGAVIAAVGTATCFLVNGISYVAVLASLWLMRPGELIRPEPVKHAKGQLRECFRYVRRAPVLRDALVMTLLIGSLTFQYQVTLSVLARRTLAAGAGGYSLLMSAMGAGAVLGGLALAGVRKPDKRKLVLSAALFGTASALVAVSPTMPAAAAAMAIVGAASIAFTSLSNSVLQLNASPRMRGRVMSLWSAAYVGSTVLGAPTVGWIGDRFSPRLALVVGAVAAVLAALYGFLRKDARPAEARAGDLAGEQQRPAPRAEEAAA